MSYNFLYINLEKIENNTINNGENNLKIVHSNIPCPAKYTILYENNMGILIKA